MGYWKLIRVLLKQFLQTEERNFEVLQRLSDTLEVHKNPRGTQEAPARTCYDLALAQPTFESGKDSIDNESMIATFHSIDDQDILYD